MFKTTKKINIYCAGCLEGIESGSIFDGEYWWHKKCYDKFYERMGYSPRMSIRTMRTRK